MTRHDRIRNDPAGRRPSEAKRSGPLTAGPRWYRTRIRTLGPLAGLAPMAALGATAWIVLRMGEGGTSGTAGLLAGVSAAPGMLIVGAPFAESDRYPLAVLASVPFWLLLGFVASRRATRPVVASWRDFWREMSFLTLAVVLGAVGALVIATAVLGETLVF